MSNLKDYKKIKNYKSQNSNGLVAVLTVGIPACGKSWYAKQLCSNDKSFIEINRDNIRKEHFNYLRNKPIRDKEGLVTDFVYNEIKECAEVGKNVIISDTNLNVGFRESLVDYLLSKGFNVEFKVFYTDVWTCIKRDDKREKSERVGREVIYLMYKRFLGQTERRVYKPNTSLPQCIVVDIDGTVALKGNRSPYDYSKVMEDTPNKSVIELVKILHQQGCCVMFLSGRDKECEYLTRKWLDKHFDGMYYTLQMRRCGDKRKDSFVKKELFFDYAACSFNVKYVIDDRPQVCQMWSDIGVNLLKVGEHLHEF